ncbi:MAG: hypothetical protein ACRDBY_14005 [Cetobacterium sp.]
MVSRYLARQIMFKKLPYSVVLVHPTYKKYKEEVDNFLREWECSDLITG